MLPFTCQVNHLVAWVDQVLRPPHVSAIDRAPQGAPRLSPGHHLTFIATHLLAVYLLISLVYNTLHKLDWKEMKHHSLQIKHLTWRVIESIKGNGVLKRYLTKE